MSEHLYLISIAIIPATILIVFGMRYVSAVQQARARLAHDGAYREIAAKAVALQDQNANLLSSIQEALAEVRTRLASVEAILKQVE